VVASRKEQVLCPNCHRQSQRMAASVE
jgi:hypothetical protein